MRTQNPKQSNLNCHTLASIENHFYSSHCSSSCCACAFNFQQQYQQQQQRRRQQQHTLHNRFHFAHTRLYCVFFLGTRLHKTVNSFVCNAHWIMYMLSITCVNSIDNIYSALRLFVTLHSLLVFACRFCLPLSTYRANAFFLFFFLRRRKDFVFTLSRFNWTYT